MTDTLMKFAVLVLLTTTSCSPIFTLGGYRPCAQAGVDAMYEVWHASGEDFHKTQKWVDRITDPCEKAGAQNQLNYERGEVERKKSAEDYRAAHPLSPAP